MLIVLSMTMATQYATTEVGYSFSIIHPSDSDIRFIGSDNSSGGQRILRVPINSTADQDIQIELGNISAGQNKTYTAAFGIVNEEEYDVDITNLRVVLSSGVDYLMIFLHGDRSAQSVDDATSEMVWDRGSAASGFTSNTTTAWTLAAGNQDSDDMSADGITQLATTWDSTSSVRYSTNDANDSVKGTSDFVWVQISIVAPTNADSSLTYSGTIYIHTRATTST